MSAPNKPTRQDWERVLDQALAQQITEEDIADSRTVVPLDRAALYAQAMRGLRAARSLQRAAGSDATEIASGRRHRIFQQGELT